MWGEGSIGVESSVEEGSGVQGGGAERPPFSGVYEQIWSGNPFLGLKRLFQKVLSSQVQDGAGRRGCHGGCNDPSSSSRSGEHENAYENVPEEEGRVRSTPM